MVREWLNPVALLSAEQREKLRPFEQPNPLNGKPALTLVHVASSARGIAALTAFAPDDTQTAIVNVDLENRKILSIIVEKPDLRVTVLPDGARAFCEEIEWRKAGSRSDGEANKPGRFFVVDLQTGKRLMEFAALELAGREFDHRVIAVAPDGSSLLYGAGQSLFIVRLDVDRHSVLRVASSFDAKAAQCGFSNE